MERVSLRQHNFPFDEIPWFIRRICAVYEIFYRRVHALSLAISRISRAALISIRCCTVNKVKLWPHTVNVREVSDGARGELETHGFANSPRDFVISGVITGGVGTHVVSHTVIQCQRRAACGRSNTLFDGHAAASLGIPFGTWPLHNVA